jgi:hypothetical protein
VRWFLSKSKTRAAIEQTNLVEHNQDVEVVGHIMARRRKGLKAAKFLCDEYLVLNYSLQKAGLPG